MGELQRMSGTPWHTEKMVRSEGDDRRHRSRCEYYNKHTKYCQQTCSCCYGASHCPYYKEKVDDVIDELPKMAPNKSLLSIEQRELIGKLRSKGTKCTHKKFGKGVVIESDGKHISIQFAGNNIKQMDAEVLVRNGLISLG